MNTEEKTQSDLCLCTSNDGLFVSNRHASAVLAGIIALISLSFLTGFFLGKKQAIEPFTHKIDQDSFADQIFSSVCALSDQEYRPDESDNTTALPEETTAEAENKTVDNQRGKNEQASLESGNEAQSPATASEQYYAQLVGFGTRKAAQNFAQKLQKKGTSVRVKTRYSKTAKGKKIAWYQVVTHPHDNREELQKLVDRIAKEETLKGARIVTV